MPVLNFDRMEDILAGRNGIDGIPDIPVRAVRVYLSAPSSDTLTERNTFVQRVYPKLREYCRTKYGLEFQVVDLGWGLSPSKDATGSMNSLRDEMIRQSQKLSVGPSFIALVGQRYGDRPLATTINAEEYETIRDALYVHKGRDTRNAALLDKWYTRDDNSVPSQFVIRKPIDMIDGFNHISKEVRNVAQEEWMETASELRRLFLRGAEYSHQDETISDEQYSTYLLSDQHREISQGIQNGDKCVVLERDIIDLHNYINDSKASEFIDIIQNDKTEILEVDNEASNMLYAMKDTAKQIVLKQNCISFDVIWRYEDVISPNYHQDYLNNICDAFVESVKRILQEDSAVSPLENSPEILEEVLQHWNRCKQQGARLHGQNDLLFAVQKYLLGSEDTPLVLYGVSGCGKTATLSKVALQVNQLFDNSAITILRYVGFTPKSSDARQLILSICTQLALFLDKDSHSIPIEYRHLQRYFHQMLTEIPKNRTLVLCIDSLHQILPDYNAHSLAWLPTTLPSNVKLVLTTAPRTNSILAKLQQEVLQNAEAYLEIQTLNPDDSVDAFMSILSEANRTVTDDQLSLIQSTFDSCSLPLYIYILAEQAKEWTSFARVDDNMIPKSCVDAIDLLFDKLEIKHGLRLFQRSMAYLLASDTGLSDCEMEDLLSLDDDVLNEVFISYHPSLRRIPSLYWLSVKQDLRAFLTSRCTDGVTVYFLFHEDMVAAAFNRYLRNEDEKRNIHSMLADYFLGTWAGKGKPVKQPEFTKDIVIFPCGEVADRLVPSQPLTFEDEENKTDATKFNRRKYDQVPRHLYLAGRTDELNRLVLFNYEWLYNKIKALSLNHIMADFALNPGMEANLVEETLRVAEETIQNDINNLPAEISGHLLPYYGVYPNIRALIQQCDSIGSKHCALVPNFPYANVPGSSLEYTFQTDFVGEFFQLSQEDKYLLSKSRDSPYVQTYDMTTGELKQTTFASSGDLYATPDGKHFVLADHVTERAIKIHRSDNGEFVGQLIVMNHIQLKPKEKYRMDALSLTNTNVCLIVTTEVSYLCIADIQTCRFLRIVVLDGRANICKVTPDYKFVFCNSNNFLMCYDLTSLEQKSDKQLPCSPTAIAFTRDASLAYVAGTQECKMYTVELHQGGMGMLYQTVLQDIMTGDKILSLKVAPLDGHVLVHGHNTVLVYDRVQEMICCYFQKPGEIPRDFKLPKGQNYDLNFTNADFSRDGNFVIATMFRNVYIWQIATSSLVTVIQTPVGIIADLVVSHRRNQLITHLKGSTDMQVWNLSEALNQICMPDRMTGVISDVKVTKDASLAYVRCKNNDDIALIDMAYGTMIDYLTHDRSIESFAITPTGENLLVATKPRRQGTAVRLWNMVERTVVKEFGNSDGYCIGMNFTAGLIFVGQENISFKAPHYIKIFMCDANQVSEFKLQHVVKYVLDKPFVTSDDKFVIFLTAQDYVESKSVYDTPTICVCTLEENSKMDCYTPSSFQNATDVETILDVRACSSQPSVIAVIFASLADSATKEERMTYDRDAGEYYGQYGVLLFDVSNGAILSICVPFMRPDVPIDGQLVFSKDFKFCLDRECNIFDLVNMEYSGWLSNLRGPPRVIALGGKVVVTYRGSHIHVVRLEDGKTIASCDVHADIRSITLCADDRTLVIGCDNGTIVSYVLLDAEDGSNEDITGTLFSRRYASQVETKEITPRSRDHISSNGRKRYTGSASRRCATPSDQELLNQVKSLPRLRPNSDTLLYINNSTRTCSVM